MSTPTHPPVARPVHLTIDVSADERGMLQRLAQEHGASVADVVRALIAEAWEQGHPGETPPPWEPTTRRSPKTPRSPKKTDRELAGATLTLRVDGSDPRVLELLKAIGGQQ
jgi:hypothetical protein